MSVLFEPEGWKARRSMELVFTLGRCLLKGYRIVGWDAWMISKEALSGFGKKVWA